MRKEPPPPLLRADALYLLSDIRRAFGLSPTTLADWKRHPDFRAVRLPSGDAILGWDLIAWLRVHRRKNSKGGTPDAES